MVYGDRQRPKFYYIQRNEEKEEEEEDSWSPQAHTAQSESVSE